MQAAIPSELLLRLIGASPERFAAVEQLLAACTEAALPAGGARESIIKIGRLEYREGFKDVWLDDVAFDLRSYPQARWCLELLVRKRAYAANSALHLRNEIDPYVREHSGVGARGKFSAIKIQDYFREPSGHLMKLCQGLIRSAGNNGKYFLQT